MHLLRSDSPIQYLKGVGPTRAEWFASLGLRTVGELLEYFPFRYEVDLGESAIADLQPGAKVTIRGEITRVRGRPPGLRCDVNDGTDVITLRWFNEPYSSKQLSVGSIVVATGRTQIYNDKLEMVQPNVQVFPPNAVMLAQESGQKRVGVYRGNATLKSALIRRAVQTVLLQPALPVEQVVPDALVERHKLLAREAAIRQIHNPAGEIEEQRARRSLAYEEFLLMELAMALRRRKLQATQSGQKLLITPEVDRRIRARFPFALTASQNEVIREIVRDLQSGLPMTRLLQGDVGSGKTVVALYACLAAIACGRQAAIMAPTEILAQQHFNNIEKYLAGSRVRRTLLRGRQGRAERVAALAAIDRGDMDLVVGTQALIQKGVSFSDLALVVVDEQHKFGVLQRHAFRTKGPMPHYLVMTATPIPRTLAMTVFGDLDVSIIKHAPPGRGRIVTKVVPGAKWESVMKFVAGRLAAGEQAYVVCPQIGEEAEVGGMEPVADEPDAQGLESQAADAAARTAIDGRISKTRDEKSRAQPVANAQTGEILVSARDAFDRLQRGPFSELNIGLVHGALRSAEKNAAIAEFAAGKLHALVATTVVEVGVDVANATIMIVENAERFGLSQLHQLRGRVGRGNKDSLCVLLVHSEGGKAEQRLEIMARTTDGFRIAEADLQQRGPGQLFGTRQHGLPELRFASIIHDFELLEKARQDAFAIVAADPKLQQPEHARMIPALRRMFGSKLALIDAA